MKKFIAIFALIFISANIYSAEINRDIFEKLIHTFYSQYDWCVMEIRFSAERFNTFDHQIHYYQLDPQFRDGKQAFQISKDTLDIYIYFEHGEGYHYTNENREEFFRNLNIAFQFFSVIHKQRP